MAFIVEPHFESTSISAPLGTYNPALIAEGYPGMPGYADPPKDNKHDSGQPSSSALAELSTEALAAGASRLPENDQAAFLDLLPQQDKVMLTNAAQQGQDADSSLAALPKADIVQALAQLPIDDVVNAFTTQERESHEGGAGTDLYAASGPDRTATVAQNADSAAGSPPSGQPGADATVDLASFERALPANDQSAWQAALAGNQNSSAKW